VRQLHQDNYIRWSLLHKGEVGHVLCTQEAGLQGSYQKAKGLHGEVETPCCC
jgi:hypothetical protein